jgi:hypothetical protein
MVPSLPRNCCCQLHCHAHLFLLCCCVFTNTAIYLECY